MRPGVGSCILDETVRKIDAHFFGQGGRDSMEGILCTRNFQQFEVRCPRTGAILGTRSDATDVKPCLVGDTVLIADEGPLHLVSRRKHPPLVGSLEIHSKTT